MKKISFLFLILIIGFTFVSCNANEIMQEIMDMFEYEEGEDVVYKRCVVTLYNNDTKYDEIVAYNDVTVPLPTLSDEYYSFDGWQDENGIIYVDEYVVKDTTTLTASWDKDDITIAGKINSKLEYYCYNISLDIEEELDNILYYYNNLSAEGKEYVMYQRYEYIISVIDTIKLYGKLDDVDENDILASKDLIIAYYELYNKYSYNVIATPDLDGVLDYCDKLSIIEKFINLANKVDKEVTIDDEALITDILDFYQTIDASLQNQLVDYYNLVIEKKQEVENLKVDVSAIIEEIDQDILALPYIINYDAKPLIDELTTKINKIGKDNISKIQYYSIYSNAVKTIEDIEKDTSTITYCLGLDNHSSKYELMENYFSDFYSFILYHYGNSVLTEKGVNSSSDFVNMAMDYYGGRDHCYNLGDNFGTYYLQQSDNNIVDNQSTDQFIGYCYQNNRYVDLIMFLIPFFNYWRLDEVCASIHNNWGDFFNSAWASCVDTCKYFYYDENTSYVKTARMIDCLTFCSSVVYGDLKTNLNGTVSLNYNLRLRGYKFIGWYDNPEFTGSKITSVTNTGKKVILYAKWVEDTEQVDKDQADFTEVVIYNLTTDTANVTEETVGYARAYYDALSANAKAQVQNYHSLVNLEAKFQNLLSEEVTLNITTNLPNKTFEQLSTEFLKDYNNFNHSNYTYDDFINNPLSIHNKTRDFFMDNEMYTKWSWLAIYFNSLDIYWGVKVQANRIIKFEGKDQEYFTKAIGCMFTKCNSTDYEFVKYDFSTSDISYQNKLELHYSNESALLSLTYSGYTFKGYYSDSKYQNKVIKAYDDMPTTLYAYFVKNS